MDRQDFFDESENDPDELDEAFPGRPEEAAQDNQSGDDLDDREDLENFPGAPEEVAQDEQVV